MIEALMNSLGSGDYSGFVQMGLRMMDDMKQSNEEWKDRIRQEWRESMKLPRKKKKDVRTGLRVDWAIAHWNPMNF